MMATMTILKGKAQTCKKCSGQDWPDEPAPGRHCRGVSCKSCPSPFSLIQMFPPSNYNKSQTADVHQMPN